MIDVFTFRGTGEPRSGDGIPSGMLADITGRLDVRRFRCREPEWPAVIGPAGSPDGWGVSLETSVAAGTRAGVSAIQESPEPCGLIGYSLGGIVVSRILEGVRSGEFVNTDGTPLDIAFAVNIANPLRRRGESVHDLCPGDTFGLHGEHGPWPDIDIQEYANPGDIITASRADSPLRLINDGIAPFSFVEGARIGDVGFRITAQLAQLFADNPLQNFERFQRAFTGVVGYLTPWPHGEHVLYSGMPMPGTDITWTTHAARHINSTH